MLNRFLNRLWAPFLLSIALAPAATLATLADPPPEGTEVAFQFSGAQNDNDGTGDEVATAVHCTNRGSDEVNVSLEFFSTDATTAFTTPAFAISSGETRTLTTQTVPALFGTDLALDFFSQASGHVLTSAADLICTVQLVDPINDQPRFLASLALHDANGELVTPGADRPRSAAHGDCRSCGVQLPSPPQVAVGKLNARKALRHATQAIEPAEAWG